MLRAALRAAWACTLHLEHGDDRPSSATTRVDGPALRRRHRRLDCDMVVVAAGIRPNVALARDGRPRRRARHRRRRRPARRRRSARLRGRRVRRAPRPGLRPGRAAVGAGAGARRSAHRTQPRRRLRRLARLDQAQGDGRRPRRDGRASDADDDDDEVVTYAEPARGIYKKLIVRDGQLAGAILLGDAGGAPALLQVFDRGTPLPDNRARAALPACAAAQAAGRRPALAGRRADLQLQRRLQGAHRRARCAAAAARLQGASATRPAPAPAAARASARCRRCSRPRPATTLAGRSGGALLRAGRAAGQAGARRARSASADLRSVSAVFAALAGGSEDPASKAGLASLLKTIWGARVRRRARRALHQRPRPRQHPEGRHLQRRAAHLRRRDAARRTAAHRRRRRQVQRADGEDHRRPAHRPARHPQGAAARRLEATSACRRATPTRRRSAPARRASAPSSAATASATAPPSASRSSGASRASSRRTR